MGVNSRLKVDNTSGKIFIPMNVEGGVDDGFFTPLKLVTTVVFGIVVVVDFMSLSDAGANGLKWLIHIAVLLFIGQLALRYILLNEKYYFKMYKKLMKKKVTTPEEFWDVVNVQDYEEGSIIIYSDMKIGSIIKLERDTIIGRDSDFREAHYDAISEFFKELNQKEFNWVKLDLMENADRDNRLSCLDDIVNSCDNANVAKLVEMHLGYLKSIARNTLYESEYFLIYTRKSSRMDTILSDINECAYRLLDGAYSKFTVLKSDEIYQLPTQIDFVRYFDASSAMLKVFNRTGVSNEKTFTIVGIAMKDGTDFEVKEKENLIIEKLASYKKAGKLVAGKWTISSAFSGNMSNLFYKENGANTGSKAAKKNVKERKTYVAEADEIELASDESNIDDIDAVAKHLREKAKEINKEIIFEGQKVEEAQTVVAESIIEESAVEESVIGESVANESVANESVTNESVTNESVTNESMRNESMRNESVNGAKVGQETKKKKSVSIFGKKKTNEKVEFNADEIREDMLKEFESRK